MPEQSLAERLPNRFDFAAAQQRLYEMWEEAGDFSAQPDASRRPFTIVIPPPNVTGALHLGHALNNSLQDILVRMRRMQGFNTLWIPGTDHAGIATQAVVERRLHEEEGKTRHDLGREPLVQRIWAWKDAYEQRIVSQLKSMGCSCDWKRQRFTLDAICATAVRRTFFDLFRRHWIYRGKRLVNWDTFLQTAVSDDEVFHETVQGHFWHIRYPVIDPRPGEPSHVIVATTRPETMLGDTAVAVHPDPSAALNQLESSIIEKLATAPGKERQELENQIENVRDRRANMLGELETLRGMALDHRKLLLPLMNREIPLVADAWAKPELGSGCVKITPAHDPNDYEVALRCDLPMINLLHPDGRLNANAGPYAGATVADARPRLVADLDSAQLLDSVEDREIDMAHSDRSKTPIEPYLADQWFVQMKTLAQSAMDAVSDGRVKIVPERYAKGYLDWLSEKRDWPVSRQLWWGHRIPIWTRRFESANQCASYVAQLEQSSDLQADRVVYQQADTADQANQEDTNESSTLHVCLRDDADELAERFESDGFVQEQDVLDTWFSSALWPHSTLGWPEPTDDLAYYYPTSVLITSRDIITLWVARMVLAGINNMGQVPFREVYIHPKILDGYGEAMSKSKGNGVDPIDVIDKFGADALRFGLAQLTTETQDVRMPVQFECPHCQKLLEQTRENRESPRITCPECKEDFATQWAQSDADRRLKRGAVVSERFEVARNFCNKLWNAARLVMLNLEGFRPGPVSWEERAFEDRWILSRLQSVTDQVGNSLNSYRYSDAARTLYDFVWDEFCSLYLEMIKVRLQESESRPVAQRVLAHVLDTILRLLHPFIPFLTEEIWQLIAPLAPTRDLNGATTAEPRLIRAAWPASDAECVDPATESQFGQFLEVVTALREIRSRQNIPPKKPIQFAVRCSSATATRLQPLDSYFRALANAIDGRFGEGVTVPTTNATVRLAEMEVFVDLEGLIDKQAEQSRLEKQLERLAGAIQGKEKKLANEKFVGRAPEQVVQRERESLVQLKEQQIAVAASLKALGLDP